MKDIIEAAFENLAHITPDSANTEVRQTVEEAIHLLDTGKARVAELKGIGEWQVNEWLKKAVLLSFRLEDNIPMTAGFTQYYDKVPSKFASTTPEEFKLQVFESFLLQQQDVALILPQIPFYCHLM